MREARSTVGAGGGGTAVVLLVNVPLVDVPLVELLALNITCSMQGLARAGHVQTFLKLFSMFKNEGLQLDCSILFSFFTIVPFFLFLPVLFLVKEWSSCSVPVLMYVLSQKNSSIPLFCS